MSEINLPQPRSVKAKPVQKSNFAAWLLGGVVLVGAFLFLSVFLQTSVGGSLQTMLKSIFAVDSVQIMWFITRSAGLTAYLLLWLSVAWGLAVPSKILDNLLHRSFTYDFHQFISLLTIGFIALHILVLMFDHYLPYSVAQILVPFLSPYRPFWVGLGVLGFYLALLVTVTFYMRSRIGMKAFRAIHVFSLLAYLGAAVHGFMAGTDTPLLSVTVMYVLTFLSTVFLSVYWAMYMLLVNKRKSVPARQTTR